MASTQQHGEPIPRQSASVRDHRLAVIAEHFPEAITEGRVDWDALRAALGDLVDDAPERYTFSWAGKRDAIRLLQTPTSATLLPSPDESVDWDTTRNAFIAGDNLEVLKLLYKPYFGRVKMIYIDPPYNTGNDFIYPDNYADPLDTYLRLTGQKDAQGNLLTSNPETSGRYHSAWLSMMYPRLFLARQLLRDDGVIFVSIDDHEVHNLRLLMNEVFGEENFVANVVWQRKQSPQNDATDFSDVHDHLLVYARKKRLSRADPEGWVCYPLPQTATQRGRYANPDSDPRGPWASVDITCNKTADQRPNLYYSIRNPNTGEEVWPSKQRVWLVENSRLGRYITEKRIWWGEDGTNFPRLKKYLQESNNGVVPTTLWLRTEVGDNQESARELRSLFSDTYGVFDTTKPTRLVERMLRLSTRCSEPDIILDFFAGSCTTAHAVLALNREDGGNRRFIMVQLPEPTGRDDYATIADIGKERIRRVIARMREEDAGKLDLSTRETPEDLGFRVYRLAPSHYRPWEGVEGETPEEYAGQMALFTDPLRPGWTAAGLLWEVALREGYGLDACIERVVAVASNAVYRVTDPDREQNFLICLDDRLHPDTPAALGLGRDDVFVCRDAALDDALAANLALQCRLKTV